jgi:hypothetical protein
MPPPDPLAPLITLLTEIRDGLTRPAIEPVLIRADEAAAMLRISEAGFRRLVAANHLAAVDLPGGGPRYRPKDIRSLAERLKAGRRRPRLKVNAEAS